MIPIRFAAPLGVISALIVLGHPIGHTAAQSNWDLPLRGVPPTSIVSEFSTPRSRFGSGHRGVDFPATQGQPVRAVGSGTVAFVGYIAGKPVVSIELANSVTALGNRVKSTYEPVTSLLSAGSYVSAGEVIGHIDFSGRTSGHCRDSCLHFGLKVLDKSTTGHLSPRILWRSLAVLLLSPVLHQSQILDGQSQKFFGAFQRSRGCNAVSLPLMHDRVALEPPSCRLPLQGHV